MNTAQNIDIHELSTFLLDFTTTLLSVGSQPSRVMRSARRIGDAFGHDVDLAIFPKHIIMTIFSNEDHTLRRTSVRDIKPAAFNFDVILKLNALSWNAWDHHSPLAELRRRYEEVMAAPRYSRWLVLGMVACANAAFCRLFGGDSTAMGAVFIATLAAFYLRQEMQLRHMDHRMVFMAAGFLASMIAGLAMHWLPCTTPEIALGTSVLFLIPGVPLINAINDIVEGHILMGITRSVNAGILIICIALGLSATLLILGVDAV